MRKNSTESLPAEVHTPPSLSAHVKRPKLYLRIDRLFPSDLPLYHRRALAVGLLTVAVAVGALLWWWSGRGGVPSGFRGGFHGWLPVGTQAAESESDPTHGDSAEPPTESTSPAEPQGTDPIPETAPSAPPSEPAETLPPEPPAEQESEALSSEPSENIPHDSAEPPAHPESESQNSPSATEAPTESVSATEPVTDPVTEPVTDPEPEAPPMPDGCFPITSADLSETLRGWGYLHNQGITLPQTLPTDSLWRGENPAVLIVNTHPYEGYHDGSPWYDPTQGGLAQTDSPNAPDGVVALGVALTRTLRDRGVTVIHLRLPTTPEESSSALYDRTEAMIRYYCRLYPDIGLVLDLRRSAELTDTGTILRTEGSVDGAPCAQLRVTVSGGRGTTALGYDLAAALALRESLWEQSPTVSRPVRVRSGSGLLSEPWDQRVLTLEMGAAGNTYAEAVRLVPPLARALDEILQKFG